jgi:hypothetical protein
MMCWNVNEDKTLTDIYIYFFNAFFKVAAGKPIWATVHSSRAILERPAEIFLSIFSSFYWWKKTPGAPPGIISGTSEHLDWTTTFRKPAGWLPHMKDFYLSEDRTYSGDIFCMWLGL